MKVSDFLLLLQKSETILSPRQTRELEDLLVEYPYFQAARALYLKGLKNLDSYKYNNELKRTAAYTTDREVLFDLITSREFDQNKIANVITGRTSNLPQIKAMAEVVAPNPETITFLGESDEKPLPQNKKHAENILDPKLFEDKARGEKEKKNVERSGEDSKKALMLGKPIAFTKAEKHSFSEWLQLASQKPIRKENEIAKPDKKKKFDLLDKFIEGNPKIVPKTGTPKKVDISGSVTLDKKQLMTETLAKVYLEQKKYKKALQAFKILGLKYPEKSGFFADQIQAIKKLQREKE